MMIKQIKYTILAATAIFSSCGAGNRSPQPEETENALADSTLIASYAFVNSSADTVYDPSNSMKPFYAKLRKLDNLHRNSGGENQSAEEPFRVNILHFGDSHIQAGFLSGTLMHHLHRRFGNAGRGMIVPHKLGGSNEPYDYAIRSLPSSGGEWSSSRIVNSRPSLPLGISGLAIQSSSPTNRLLLCTFSPEGLDYRFNRVRVFHGRYAPIIAASDSLSTDGYGGDMLYDFNTDLELVQLVDTLELRTYADGEYARGPIYGFSLENGDNGVLYHAMGINSACFLHWGRQTEIIRQSTALEPDLIILSMGANEAADNQFSEAVFYRSVDRFVRPLREANPAAAVVLTSPVQAFKRGEPNTNYEGVARTLKRYAQEKGVAFIDLYAMGGGEGSAVHWADQNLLARDKIHYTEEGYNLQGLLLYNAFYNGYIGYGRTAH